MFVRTILNGHGDQPNGLGVPDKQLGSSSCPGHPGQIICPLGIFSHPCFPLLRSNLLFYVAPVRV